MREMMKITGKEMGIDGIPKSQSNSDIYVEYDYFRVKKFINTKFESLSK